MAISPKKMIQWLNTHYDKIIAAVVLLCLLSSLLYLAIRVGMIKKMQEQFDHDINSIKPTHEHAETVDPKPFNKTFADLEKPAQVNFEQWTTNKLVVVPEQRVWCVGCRGLIWYDDNTCPFCGEPNLQDDHPVGFDMDNDGMDDIWEKKHNLNHMDKADASEDPDKDLFTNIEEYLEKEKTASTDPRDPESHPPYEPEVVTKIKVIPFSLIFRSLMKRPGKPVLYYPTVKKTFSINSGTEITPPANSIIELPDRTPYEFPANTSIRYLDVLDFSIIKKVQDKEEELKKFMLFDESELKLPEKSQLIIPGKKTLTLAAESFLKPYYDYKFGLNLKRKVRGKITTKTFFVMKGETVNGFEVISYTPRQNEKNKQPMDELVLKRGNRIIKLIFNVQNRDSDRIVYLRFGLDPQWQKTLNQKGETFELMGKTYELINIDTESETIVIQRLDDKKEFTVGKPPEREKETEPTTKLEESPLEESPF